MPLTFEYITHTNLVGVNSATISSIPATYTDLRIFIFAPMTSGDRVAIRFNGDTATNYLASGYYTSGAGTTFNYKSNADNNFTLSSINTNVTYPDFHMIDVFGYSSTANKTKNCIMYSSQIQTSTVAGVTIYGGYWNNTGTAINSLTIFGTNATNFSSGSYCSIYGIKAA